MVLDFKKGAGGNIINSNCMLYNTKINVYHCSIIIIMMLIIIQYMSCAKHTMQT